MRLDLRQRLCGRCSTPCEGYWEPDDALEPPHRCAECSIKATRSVRVGLWAMAVGFGLLTACAIGASLSLGVMALTLLGIPGASPANGMASFFFLGIALLLAGGLSAATLSTLRLAGRESRRVEEIRTLAQREDLPRGRPKDNHRWFGNPETRFRISSFESPVWGPPPPGASPWEWPEK
ncbi:MAG: hypothetical protein HYY93_10670 [Planctomycetes bacterium]|nr:hypothetical protein [Planctomycetota bacterium]